MKVGKGRTAVTLDIKRLSEGMIVSVTGGKSHIGVVVMAADGEIQVWKREEHEEEEIAINVTKAFAAKTTEPILCYCGIHIEEAKPEEIEQITKNAETAAKRYTSKMKVTPKEEKK